MFGSNKRKQQKKKKQSSQIKNANKYYQKIKDKCFEIYLNSGINQLNQSDHTQYTSMITINALSEFSQNLLKNFSSIYQIDHKSFEWKQKIESLVKNIKEVLKILQKLKKQVNQFNLEKQKVNEMSMQNIKIREQSQEISARYNQLIEFQSAKQSSFHLRQQQHYMDLNKELIETKKLVDEKNSQIQKLRQNNQEILEEIGLLKDNIDFLTNQNDLLKQYLHKIKKSCFDQKIIHELLYQDNNLKIMKNPCNMDSIKINQKHRNLLNQSIFQSQVLGNSKLSSLLISFLQPKNFVNLFSLSKSSRFFLAKSHCSILSCFSSIINFKNYQISYFHRHINYFQKRSKKIPQEIIQSSYYQYNILKQNIGGDFMSILNLCGKIFEGKFTSVNQSKTSVKQYIQSKQIIHFVEMPKQDQIYLRIDKIIVEQFFEERKLKKEIIMKEIQTIHKKIITTQSLYLIDQQTLKEFYQNIIKNFIILFVLSKYLYNQARNMQHLNTFLLSQLSQIDKFKIQKQYDLEDVKTQVQTSQKTIQFLNSKANKSEQRILLLSKQQSQQQKQYLILRQKFENEQYKVKKLIQQNKRVKNENDKMIEKSIEIKSLYNMSKQKYNCLLNQLSVVKQTVMKIK